MAAATPLAAWLADYAESRGWTSARQAARYLDLNPAVLGTWLRGEYTPDAASQEHLARATATPLERVAALARATRQQTSARSTGARMHAGGPATPGAGFDSLSGLRALASAHAHRDGHAVLLVGPLGMIEGRGNLAPDELAAIQAIVRRIDRALDGEGGDGAPGGRGGGDDQGVARL